MDRKILFSVNETASALGLGRGTVWKMIREGKLRAVRIGNRVLVPQSVLEEFAEHLEPYVSNAKK